MPEWRSATGDFAGKLSINKQYQSRNKLIPTTKQRRSGFLYCIYIIFVRSNFSGWNRRILWGFALLYLASRLFPCCKFDTNGCMAEEIDLCVGLFGNHRGYDRGRSIFVWCIWFGKLDRYKTFFGYTRSRNLGVWQPKCSWNVFMHDLSTYPLCVEAKQKENLVGNELT